eukprot:jgi/Psemu1/1074/gm1.1074_g
MPSGEEGHGPGVIVSNLPARNLRVNQLKSLEMKELQWVAAMFEYDVNRSEMRIKDQEGHFLMMYSTEKMGRLLSLSYCSNGGTRHLGTGHGGEINVSTLQSSTRWGEVLITSPLLLTMTKDVIKNCKKALLFAEQFLHADVLPCETTAEDLLDRSMGRPKYGKLKETGQTPGLQFELVEGQKTMHAEIMIFETHVKNLMTEMQQLVDLLKVFGDIKGMDLDDTLAGINNVSEQLANLKKERSDFQAELKMQKNLIAAKQQ